MSRQKSINRRTLVFIFTMGISIGLLLILNSFLTYIFGYAAIYTGLLTILVAMYLIIRFYKLYFDKDLDIVNSIIISLPIFIVATILNYLISNYDYDHSVTYVYYSNGYFLNLLEETSKQFIPLTLFFSLLFIPVYKFVARQRTK